ncbi:MAG: glycosyltransferase family 2 protein [Lachnospiraceae bacterium]|nr:glycosyltransferase family 2 protein [Lachnospiraceae bacterium]
MRREMERHMGQPEEKRAGRKILSVVVPMYQAEAYIARCLDSFLIREPEALSRVEILVIDDGGTDGAAAIAETYAKRYPDTYRVFHKENGGHGSGINFGIAYAEGTYFKVVDADDWVDTDAFGRLVRELERLEKGDADTDVVYTGFRWVSDNGQTGGRMGILGRRKTRRASMPRGQKARRPLLSERLWAGYAVASGKRGAGHTVVPGRRQAIRFPMPGRHAESGEPFKGVVYGRTYSFDKVADRIYMKMHHMTIRTEILKKHRIRLDEHCYYVDMEFITFPVPYVNTICFLDESVYRYRIGVDGQSVAIKSMQKNEENYDRVIRSLLEFYARQGAQIPCSEAKKRYIASIIARMAAGKAKILLSYPEPAGRAREWRTFDERMKAEYPEVYQANRNPALTVLRVTGYRTLGLLSFGVRRFY